MKISSQPTGLPGQPVLAGDLPFRPVLDADGEGTDQGAVPAEDRPPVNVVRASFGLMVVIGTGLAVLGLLYLVVWWRKRRLPAAFTSPMPATASTEA